jgi:hypothetical protein
VASTAAETQSVMRLVCILFSIKAHAETARPSVEEL